MKVLITGGAGFVGSHTVDRLLARGDKVLVIDNFATGRRDNLRPHDALTIIEGSIADPKLVRDAFDSFRPDVVMHAAAAYKNPDGWEEDILTNALGSIHVARGAVAHKVKRVIYFQTALCYGLNPTQQPIQIDYQRNPEGSSYAFSKTAGEQYLELSNVNLVSFRLANAYGPRNISGPLPTFYSRLTDGKACFVMDTRRDFIYINDLVDVVVRAIDGEGKPGHYHVSSGGDVSIKELFDATVEAMNIKLDKPVEVRPRNPDDAFTILLDPSKTQAQFPGWKTTTSLKKGVADTIAYYRKHGIAETFTHLRLPGTDAAKHEHAAAH